MELELKEINIKTLVTGDQQAKIVLYSTTPEQIDLIKQLAGTTFVKVTFENAQKDS